MTNVTDLTAKPTQESTISTGAAPSPIVKVRLLIDSKYGQCNDVVFIESDQLASLSKAGAVDASPKAIAYAESLKN